jgi:hypothetical protein
LNSSKDFIWNPQATAIGGQRFFARTSFGVHHIFLEPTTLISDGSVHFIKTSV